MTLSSLGVVGWGASAGQLGEGKGPAEGAAPGLAPVVPAPEMLPPIYFNKLGELN